MHSTQQHPAERQEQDRTASGDPRVGWRRSQERLGYADGTMPTPGDRTAPAVPVLRHRRDGILPAVAGALSVRGETLTCTGSKGEAPELHPLVQGFLDSLTTAERERHAGRCPEAVLLSRFLTSVDAARAGKRAGRKPLSHSDAKRALKQAKLTTRRIREDGDPRHGGYAPPCRSCAPLLAHFGVRVVAPDAEAVR